MVAQNAAGGSWFLVVIGEQATQELGHNILRYLTSHLGPSGAIVYKRARAANELVAGYGVPEKYHPAWAISVSADSLFDNTYCNGSHRR